VLAVAGGTKEVVVLFDGFERRRMFRAEVRLELTFGKELLAAAAIEAAVGARIDVAGAGTGAPQLGDRGCVASIRARLHEVVEVHVQRTGQARERSGVFRDQQRRRRARAGGSSHGFQAVVVRSGLETNIPALTAALSDDGVGKHVLLRVAQVRRTVYVRDGRGDETAGGVV